MHGAMNVRLQKYTSLSSVDSNMYKFITPLMGFLRLGVIGELEMLTLRTEREIRNTACKCSLVRKEGI